MIYVFWLAILFLGYTFVGYPVLVAILSVVRDRTHKRSPIWPTVSVIIPAHNEAKVIGGKIVNTLELDYPRDKMEIIVASDASEDATSDIVSSFADRGVKLVEIPGRRGKHHAQMVARDSSHGEILVFTDAAVRLDEGALRQIVSNFSDPSVGCVSSEDSVGPSKNKSAPEGEGSYIQLEMRLRRLESRVHSLVNVSGSFFAARRTVCDVWHPGMSSDFFIPLHAVERGLRAVVDPACRNYYGVVPTQKAEFARKVRTIVHGLDGFFVHLNLLNPFKYGLFSWQFFSHKLCRWLIPFAVFPMLVANIFLARAGIFYGLCLVLQGGLYAAGAVTLAVDRLAKSKPFGLAGFFLLGNIATLVAWWHFLRGEKLVTWQPSERA